jgi:prepilin-type N-terminal cleavage/methylation domain-containing protein
MPQRATLFRGIFWKETSVRKNAESPLPNAARRRGFSLVELLVVVAIIGTLIGILLPAVQSAREAGRRMSCQNNLRQIGIGFHNYHAALDCFPAAVSGNGARHYWIAQILPYLEDNPLAEIYDYTVACNNEANKTAVQTTVIFTICPSTPGGPRQHPKFKLGSTGWWAAVSDYTGAAGPSGDLWDAPAVVSYPEPTNMDGFFKGTIKPGERGRRIRDILDGTSKSIAVFEAAGRPHVWAFGNMIPGSGLSTSPSALYAGTCAWADANHVVAKGFFQDSTAIDLVNQVKTPGPVMINGSNRFGAYAFHPNGLNSLLLDGSCRFMAEDASADVVAAALTIAGGEMVQLP